MLVIWRGIALLVSVFGDVYIDRHRRHAVGVDSVAVRREGGVWYLTGQAGASRTPKVVFEDGISIQVALHSAETTVDPTRS